MNEGDKKDQKKVRLSVTGISAIPNSKADKD